MSRGDYDSLLESLSSSKRKPLAPEVGRLRAVKSKWEQAVMRQAADISARAHNKVRGPAVGSGFLLTFLCRLCGSPNLGCQSIL